MRRMFSAQTAIVSYVCLFAMAASADAQTAIVSLQPASCQPGVSTKFTLRGSKLPNELRVRSNRQGVTVAIESPTADSAIVAITVPKDSRPGPLGLWFASSTGPIASKVVLVDDMPTVLDNGSNHSLSTAQSVATLGAIDGVSEGNQSDYYRFSAIAGQRVAFEVLTQSLRSKMDPMLRLFHSDGRTLQVADDDLIGPECRFSYTFVESGEYLLQVSDSNFAVGGEYHLRIGDFPILHHAFPLAVQTDAATKLSFTGPDADILEDVICMPPSDATEEILAVPVRVKEGGLSSAWQSVLVSSFPQTLEPSQLLESQVGISGRLRASGEKDTYRIQGKKSQTLRFESRTRSLGCTTLLQMQLWNAAGAKVAETAVSDSDEWSFEYTVPNDGEFRLEVGDLLKRGGSEFGYWIQVSQATKFAIAFKADAKTVRSFAIEESNGGSFVDLVISRSGYEGEIDLSLVGGSGLRLLNPRIGAKVKEHRAIILSSDDWKAPSNALARLHAKAVENTEISCDVSSRSLARMIEPHVIVPGSWNEGVLNFVGAPKTPSTFALEATNTILLDRASSTHNLSLNIKRSKDGFKGAVVLDGRSLGSGWTLATKGDGDRLSLTINRPSADSLTTHREPSELSLVAYAELPERVRWENLRLPVKWIDVPERLEVFPPVIELEGSNSVQQLVVTGYDATGQARDWTKEMTLVSTNSAVASVHRNTIVPVANGDTEVVVHIGEKKQSIPVKVTSFEKTQPIAFEREVLVALSKQGCNSGACHGSPSGKGNFRLSLRAFDRVLDELTLIREDDGRRVNPIEPDESLLLLKPSMKLAHGGGKQISSEDVAYKILRTWIAEGAKPDPPGAPRCDQLEVYPSQKRILKLSDGTQQLSATAHFTDGKKRDVTPLVAYESTNAEVASVDKTGLVSPHGRGEAVILVRYLEHIESIPMMFVDDVPGFEWSQPSPSNYVDHLVNAKLKQLQYLPAPTCSDSEFLRRVYLDVIGILPTVEEAQAFQSESSETKRSKLIDSLLERDEYPKFWALKWGDLLQMTSKSVGVDGVYKYHRWVEEAIRSNMPYDQFARELLTSSGSTLTTPAANFYRTSKDMNECVETVSQVFLGARLQCAKCHNHPFERWTQDNYYGLGAFFNRMQRRQSQRPGEMFVWTATSGEVTQPRTGEIMKPWLPQVGSIDVKPEDDRRPAFVDWLIDVKNPYFAKIEANRIWSQLFARGIVNPIDDFRDSNPPSNEPLLEALAKDFVESGFNRKHLLRTILNSASYQASSQASQWNERDKMYFSHQSPRILSAEQLLDAINQLTGLSQSFAGLPSDMKATQLPAPDIAKSAFLKVFGQPERATVCACERDEDSNLGMAIELFNGPIVHEKLRDSNNRFRKLHSAGKDCEEVVRELYMAALSRPPTDAELKSSMDHCQTASDLVSGYEDLCWVLLNTDEFLFQH